MAGTISIKLAIVMFLLPMFKRHISLRQLRAFHAVATAGSFAEAARALHVTRSALSELIKQLEQRLGARLFDRTTRRVSLSIVGAQFFDDVEAVLSALGQAVQRIEDGVVGDGLVRIIGSPVMLKGIVIPSLAGLRQRYPKVRVSLVEAGARDIYEQVRDGRVDFGIGAIDEGQEADLHCLPLFDDRFGVVAPAGSPWLGGPEHEIALEELAGRPFIGLTDDTLISRSVAGHPRAPASVRQPQMRVSNPTLLGAAIEQGLGVSVLTALSAHFLGSAKVAFRLLRNRELVRTMHLLARPDRSLAPAAAIVWEAILQDRTAVAGVPGLSLLPLARQQAIDANT